MTQVASGTFTATGSSTTVKTSKRDQKLNVSLSDFGVATIDLERSFDDEVTWKVVESYTADTQKVAEEPEAGVSYRLTASAYTSGTIAFRLAVAE